MKQRLISTAQLAFTLFLVIILTSCSTQPSQAKTKEPPKNKIIENWTRTTITLYRSPSSLNSFQPDDAVQELEAKKAVYDSWESSNREYVEMEVIVFADPKSGRIYIGSPFPFFTETKSGIFGMDVDEGGIGWMPGLINVSEISGGIEEAISQFEKKFDYYNEFLAPSAGDRVRAATDLYTALGGPFPGGGSATSSRPKVVSVNIRREILELDLESLSGESKANVWVNMETCAVIKALRDGKTPPPPPPSEPPPKIKIKENWSPTKITLYRSSSSLSSFQPGDAVEELEAKAAVYEVTIPWQREHTDEQPVVTFTDPKSGRVYIGLPYPFFIETKSGIFGVDVNSGFIGWEPSLVDVSISSGGTKKAISRFENDVYLSTILWRPEFLLSKSRTDLDTVLGPYFFSGGSSIGYFPPRILSINISNQTLELNLKSSRDQSVGNVWVDMETHQVVKALRDGKTPPTWDLLKSKIKENWSPTKITLYRSSSSFNSFQAGDAVEELEAQKAIYELAHPLPESDETLPFTLITFSDPKSGRVYIGLSYPFFAETKSGIFGVDVNSGSIGWEPSLVHISVSSGGTKKAISRLEREINLHATICDPELPFSKSYTDLDSALGPGFFSGASSGGYPPPRILGTNISGQTLKLDLSSSVHNSVGNVWVDMETHQVIKALRDGKTPPPPWPTEPPPPPLQTTNKP